MGRREVRDKGTREDGKDRNGREMVEGRKKRGREKNWVYWFIQSRLKGNLI